MVASNLFRRFTRACRGVYGTFSGKPYIQAMTTLTQIGRQGQSDAAKAFVARREAADRSIAAAKAHRA